jgi:hypothetical protein
MSGITTEKTVWCSVCSHWDTQPMMKHQGHTLVWRKQGWKKDKKHGWLCPKCAAELARVRMR